MIRVISVLTSEGGLGCSVRISQGTAGPGIPSILLYPFLIYWQLQMNYKCVVPIDIG
jgi:hypothetical protein